MTRVLAHAARRARHHRQRGRARLHRDAHDRGDAAGRSARSGGGSRRSARAGCPKTSAQRDHVPRVARAPQGMTGDVLRVCGGALWRLKRVSGLRWRRSRSNQRSGRRARGRRRRRAHAVRARRSPTDRARHHRARRRRRCAALLEQHRAAGARDRRDRVGRRDPAAARAPNVGREIALDLKLPPAVEGDDGDARVRVGPAGDHARAASRSSAARPTW